MDSSYFGWHSDLVGLDGGHNDREHSLQDLLNSIPTDIPKNASEFDEELRSLIIALYSDDAQSVNSDDRHRIPDKEAVGYEKEANRMQNEAVCKSEATRATDIHFAIKGLGEDMSKWHPYLQSELILERGVSRTGTPSSNRVCGDTADPPCYTETRSENCEQISVGKKKAAEFVGSQEDYQKNLDDLDDGKTARMLSTVSTWLSRISSEASALENSSSQNILSSISLLNDLPETEVHVRSEGEAKWQVNYAGLDLQEHPVKLLCDDVPDCGSVKDAVSRPGAVDGLCRAHSLSVISEESETTAKQIPDDTEHYLRGLHSESSLSTAFGCDSGIGLFPVVTDVDSDVTDSSEPEEILVGDVWQASPSAAAIATDQEMSFDSSSTQPARQVACDLNPANRSREMTLDDLQLELNEVVLSPGENKPNRIVDLNAKVESQVESFSSDYAVAMKEKLEMQRLIWDLEERLVAEKKFSEVRQSQNASVEDQKEELLITISGLEGKLLQLEKQSSERDVVICNAMRKLSVKETMCGELVGKIETLEGKIGLKGVELDDTKKELKECLKISAKTVEEKVRFEAEIKLVSTAFQKMRKNKEWLEFQLKTFQESRTRMGVDFEEIKAEVKEKKRTACLLQTENANLSRKLCERDFVSLTEKQEILKQMEKIETEITESESDYSELEKKQEFLNDALIEKNNTVEIHEKKIQELIGIVGEAEMIESDLREEILKKNNILNEMSEAMEDSEAKRGELEVIMKDMNIQHAFMNEKCSKLEEDMLKMNSVVEMRDLEVERLAKEKTDLETQLDLARNEKTEIENAAGKLKSDMQIVNRIFQVMKRDLAAKSLMLQNIDSKKLELVEGMRDLQTYLIDQDKVQSDLRCALDEKIEIIRELVGQKNELSDDVKKLTARYECLENEMHQVMLERDNATEECKEVKR